MNKYFKGIAALAFAISILVSSCTESKTNTEEKTEINSMDSISKEVKQSTDKLKEQTKKVEESLEKLDKEFDTNK